MRPFVAVLVALSLASPIGVSAQVQDAEGNANTYAVGERNNGASGGYLNAFAYCSAPSLALSPLGGPFIDFGMERDTVSFINNHEEIGESDVGYTAGQYVPGTNYAGMYVHNEQDFNPGATVDLYPISSISPAVGHTLGFSVESNTSLSDVYIDGALYVSGIQQVAPTAFDMSTFLASAMQVTTVRNEVVDAQEFNVFAKNSYCSSMSMLYPNGSQYVSWPAPGNISLSNVKNVPQAQSGAAAVYAYDGAPYMSVSVGDVPSAPEFQVRDLSALAFHHRIATISYPDDLWFKKSATKRLAKMQQVVDRISAWRGSKVSVEAYSVVTEELGRGPRVDVSQSRTVYFVRKAFSSPLTFGLDCFLDGTLAMIFDSQSGDLLEAHISGDHVNRNATNANRT